MARESSTSDIQETIVSVSDLSSNGRLVPKKPLWISPRIIAYSTSDNVPAIHDRWFLGFHPRFHFPLISCPWLVRSVDGGFPLPRYIYCKFATYFLDMDLDFVPDKQISVFLGSGD